MGMYDCNNPVPDNVEQSNFQLIWGFGLQRDNVKQAG